MTRGRWIAVALGVAVTLLLARALAVAFVEFRWYAAFGAGGLQIWRARAVDLTILRAGAFVAAALFLYVNLLGVASSIDAVAVSRRLGGIEIAETVPARRLRGVFALTSALFGLVMAAPISDWVLADAILTGHGFGEIEPYTGHDLGFFVYWLPFENGLYAWVLITVAFVAGAVVALYALTPGLRWARGRLRVTVRVRRHLALFGVATLLLLAWGHRLDAYALLVDGSGTAGGFSGTDELAVMPVRFGLAIASALAAVVVLRAGWAGQARLAFWTVTGVVLATILGRSLAAPLGAALLPPDRLASANAAAVANRALYTRRAFGADRVTAQPPLRDSLVTAGAPRSAGAAARVTAVATSVPIWDPGALIRLVGDPRAPEIDPAIRVGLQSVGADVAAVVAVPRPRPAPGQTETAWRAVLLDPRAPDPLAGPPARGALAGSDSLGPVASIPRVLDVPGVIFPGAGEAALVRDTSGRVVGESFDRWIVRLATALAARDLRLLDGGPDTALDARLVRRRDPRARVQALLPFLSAGPDATPVVSGDTLWWAVELAAGSADYPVSAHQLLEGYGDVPLASLRHAGTALVNAATGEVRVIPVRDPDIDVRGWFARFRRVLTRSGDVPPALLNAIPVPLTAAQAQAQVYAEYGPRGTTGDLGRRIATGDGADTSVTRRAGDQLATYVSTTPGSSASNATGSGVDDPEPNAVATAAPGRPAFSPFVPTLTFPVVTNADRVAGVIAATGGAAPRTTWVPLLAPGPRWQEVVESTSTALADQTSRLRAAAVAGTGVTGTGVTGGTAPAIAAASPGAPGQVVDGHLSSVPTADGLLLFTRSHYAITTDARLALTGVSVTQGAGVVHASSLRALYGTPGAAAVGRGSTSPPTPATADQRLAAALGFYQDARRALQRADFSAFGRALDALGRALAPVP